MKRFRFKLKRLGEAIIYHLKWGVNYPFYSPEKELKKLLKKSLVDWGDEEHNSIQYNNDFVILNNKWGEFKVKGGYKQRIDKALGWWYIAPYKNKGVLGYPEIKSYYSKHISKINNLLFEWRVKMKTTKKRYNLAMEFWMLKSKVWDWGEVLHEVMVWEDYHISTPAGKYIDTVSLSGVKYHMYSAKIDKSSENLGVDGWTLTTFLRDKPQRKTFKSGVIDIKEILKQLIDKGVIDKNDDLTLHNIEMGTEVYNSSGYCLIEHAKLYT